jgi:hypothetical protein
VPAGQAVQLAEVATPVAAAAVPAPQPVHCVAPVAAW